MKRTPIRRVSDKQKAELALRRKLKAELIAEFGDDCMHCGGRPDWRGIQLIHKIPLSRGGKTSRENCRIWCAPCHFGPDGHRWENS